MKNVQDELVEALQMRLIGLNGVKVHYDVCSAFSTNTEDLGENFIVNHVARTFDTTQFDNLVSFFEQEAIHYIRHLHDAGVKASDLFVLFREVPVAEKRNTIRYISIVRKKI